MPLNSGGQKMGILMQLVLLIIGFVMLVKGADWFVRRNITSNPICNIPYIFVFYGKKESGRQ